MPFPPLSLLTAFLAASVILAVTPGPGVLFIVSRTLAEGRRAGLASVLGIALGNLGNAVLAALGLALVLQLFPFSWQVLKYLGSAYLAYLGIRTMMLARTPSSGQTGASAVPGRVFQEAFYVAVTNPKTALFFAAFLPTFTRPTGNLPQIIVLGTLFVAMALVTDTAYDLAAGSLAPVIARRPRARIIAAFINGAVFLALAMLTALTSPPPAQAAHVPPGQWLITKSAIAWSSSRVAPPAAWTDMPQRMVTT